MPLPEKEGNETERFEEMGLKCQRFKALPIYRGTTLRHDTGLGGEAAARIETLHQRKAKSETRPAALEQASQEIIDPGQRLNG